MRKLLLQLAFPLFAVAAGAWLMVPVTQVHAAEEYEAKSISDVMKQGLGKNGLMEKLKKGKATEEETVELLNMFIDLYEAEPPKGSAESWQELAGKALLVTAKAAAGRTVEEAEINEATNCMACHKAHRKEKKR